MMKPAEDRDRDDLSADLGDRQRSGDRYPLPQTLMGPSAIEVDLDVLLQNATQLSLADYDHVVEALPAHRTKKAFTDGVQIWGARRDLHNLDLSALGHGGEPFPELVIVVSDEVLRSVTVRRGLEKLLSTPDDLEEISMSAQQRLGTDHGQGVSLLADQSGKGADQGEPVDQLNGKAWRKALDRAGIRVHEGRDAGITYPTKKEYKYADFR